MERYSNVDFILIGNPRLPKWDHLRELHETIKMCEPALVLGDAEKFTFGPKQEVIAMKSMNIEVVLFLPSLFYFSSGYIG